MSNNLSIGLTIVASVGGAIQGLSQFRSNLFGVRKSTDLLQQKQYALWQEMRNGPKKGLSELNRMQRAYEHLGVSIQRTERYLTKLQAREERRRGIKEGWANLKKDFLGTAATAYTLSKPIQLAVGFESAMADVKKVVDFNGVKELKQMESGILSLTREIPMTAEQIANIVAQGGQAGIAKKELIGFAKTAAQMGVAFDMGADQAGTAMATLSNVLGIPIGQINQLGDAINHLSDNANSKASDIVNVLTRAGSDTKLLKLTQDQSAALASTFLSMGKAPDLAAQAIKGMSAVFQDLKAGKHAKELEQMGLSTKVFAKAMNEDAQGAIFDFIERLKLIPENQRYAFSSAIFGRQYADDLMLLSQNVGEYRRQLQLVQEVDQEGHLKYSGSMGREFENRSRTTQANLLKLKNILVEIGIRLGSAVLPRINQLADLARSVSISINQFLDQHPQLSQWIAGILSLGAVFKVAGFLVRGTGLGLISFATTVAGFFGTSLYYTKTLLGSLRLVSINLGAKLVPAFGLLQKGLIGTQLGYRGITQGLALFTKGIAANTVALLSNPVVAVIAAIITAGLLLYKYWKPIKGFFIGFWIGLVRSAKPFRGLLKGISYGFSLIWSTLEPIISPVLRFFSSLFSLEQAAEGGARSLGETIGLAVGDAIRGIFGLFSKLWKDIKGLWSGGLEALGRFILDWNPLGLFYQIFSGVLNWFGVDIPVLFSDFGSNMISSLVSGIMSAWESLKGGVSSVFDSITNIGKSVGSFFSWDDTPPKDPAPPDPSGAPNPLGSVMNQQSEYNNTHMGSQMHVNYAPTIQVNGQANAQEVQAAARISQAEFDRMLRNHQDTFNRRRF